MSSPAFPPQFDDEEYESPFRDRPAPVREPVSYRGAASDPVFGYLVAIALSLGLVPLIPDQADLRYVIIWGVMAGFGVLSWLLGDVPRIGQEMPENLAWGLIFGLIVGVPLLMVGGETLHETARRLFVNMSVGATAAFLVFVMPLAETLFFRGLLQASRPFWLVGALASLWSILVFFPLLDVGRFPAVAVVIGVTLALMNQIYGYVCQRNGLAAAWLCQIVVNLAVLFVPFL